MRFAMFLRRMVNNMIALDKFDNIETKLDKSIEISEKRVYSIKLLILKLALKMVCMELIPLIKEMV